MILTYWIAKRLDDGKCYSIREKTRKEVLRQLKEEKCVLVTEGYGKIYKGEHREYDIPEKVVIHYTDSFDLLRQALGEGGTSY